MRRDRFHESARALFAAGRPSWYTSILVWSEAYSWILHRSGEDSVRLFRQFADSLTDLTVLASDANNDAETCRLLDSLRGARITYTDVSSLAFMARHGIDTVCTDHHLALTGAQVLPRG